MSKSVLKKEPVEFEFNDEKYELVMCRAYIQSGPVMAYRKLVSGLPGQAEIAQAALELSDYLVVIEAEQEKAEKAKLSDEATQAAIVAALPEGAFGKVMEWRRQQVAIENEFAQEIYDAKLEMLLPALMSWNIDDGELQLPEDRKDNDAKRAIFEEYGVIGESALEAMWQWYVPTTVALEDTTEATSKADTTKPRSSTPATANSEASTQSLSPTK